MYWESGGRQVKKSGRQMKCEIMQIRAPKYPQRIGRRVGDKWRSGRIQSVVGDTCGTSGRQMQNHADKRQVETEEAV